METFKALVERLLNWSQNEEMVDAHYTQHGRDCNAAREALLIMHDALLRIRDERDCPFRIVAARALDDIGNSIFMETRI